MNADMSKNIGLCPECGTEVRFKKAPFLDQMITCRRCDTQLRVVRKSPIELRFALDDDWDEELDTEPSEEVRPNRRRKDRWT